MGEIRKRPKRDPGALTASRQGGRGTTGNEFRLRTEKLQIVGDEKRRPGPGRKYPSGSFPVSRIRNVHGNRSQGASAADRFVSFENPPLFYETLPPFSKTASWTIFEVYLRRETPKEGRVPKVARV